MIVEGRAPIWRYEMALRRLHGSPAAAVAFYDPRLGEVVVATHSQERAVGQVVDKVEVRIMIIRYLFLLVQPINKLHVR